MMSSRFETFSFLPPLSPAQAQAQADDMLAKGYVPMIEYAENPSMVDVYWQLWPVVSPRAEAATRPATQDVNASLLMMQIDACARRHPYAYVRLSGYDRQRRVNAVSFIVKTPMESAG